MRFKNNIETLLVVSFMDLKLRYQSTFLGFFWSFFKPFLQFLVYYTIFGKLLHVGSGAEYALKLFFGVIVWAWFAEGTTLGMNAFIGKRSIITKIKTNRLLPPLAAFLTPTINYILNFFIFITVFLVLMPLSGMHLNIGNLLIFIYSLVCISILIISTNLVLASANVFFRDLQPIWELVLTYGVFLTPVIYQIPVPAKYEVLYYSLNLLAFPLQNLKSVFFTTQANLFSNLSVVFFYNFMLLFILFLGLFIHHKFSRYVADYL